jgi:hypothetical protein
MLAMSPELTLATPLVSMQVIQLESTRATPWVSMLATP